jgi:hypothetical protein
VDFVYRLSGFAYRRAAGKGAAVTSRDVVQSDGPTRTDGFAAIESYGIIGGNLPQGLSHLALLNAAALLDDQQGG